MRSAPHSYAHALLLGAVAADTDFNPIGHIALPLGIAAHGCHCAVIAQADGVVVALHKVCRPVEKFDRRLHKLLDDMRETLADANGVGLAAPQVGILRRVVIVDTGDDILELVNPELVETDGEQEGAEGCLSVPGKYGLVKRPYYAKVRAQDRDGNWYEAEGEELIARCFCHEIDHLDGIVYTEVMERFLTDEELRAEAEDDE